MQRRLVMSFAVPAAPGAGSVVSLRADSDMKPYQFTIPQTPRFNQLSKRSRRTLLSTLQRPDPSGGGKAI